MQSAFGVRVAAITLRNMFNKFLGRLTKNREGKFNYGFLLIVWSREFDLEGTEQIFLFCVLKGTGESADCSAAYSFPCSLRKKNLDPWVRNALCVALQSS